MEPDSQGKTGCGLYADGMVEHDDDVGPLLDLIGEPGVPRRAAACRRSQACIPTDEEYAWILNGMTPAERMQLDEVVAEIAHAEIDGSDPGELEALELATELLAVGDVLLARGIGHDRAEYRHFVADSGVADLAAHRADAALAILRRLGAQLGLGGAVLTIGLADLPRVFLLLAAPRVLPAPERIAGPTILADEVDLDRADVAIELGVDDRVHHLPTMVGDFADKGPLLLEGGVVLGDLAEGPIENRHIMFDAEAKIRIVGEGPLTGRFDVGRFQRHRLVPVGLRQLDPAVPIAVLHVGSPEENEPAFQFLSIDKESHRPPPSVQNLCRLIG